MEDSRGARLVRGMDRGTRYVGSGRANEMGVGGAVAALPGGWYCDGPRVADLAPRRRRAWPMMGFRDLYEVFEGWRWFGCKSRGDGREWPK